MIVPRLLSGKAHFIPLTATCVFNCPLSGCRASGVYYSELTLESYPLRNVRSGVNTTPFFPITKPQSWRGCRLVQNCTVFLSSFDLCGAGVRCKYKNIARWQFEDHMQFGGEDTVTCVFTEVTLGHPMSKIRNFELLLHEWFFALVPISNISLCVEVILTTFVFSIKVYLYSWRRLYFFNTDVLLNGVS